MFNILIFKNFKGWSWLVKLNDFEYVRRIDDLRTNETILTVSLFTVLMFISQLTVFPGYQAIHGARNLNEQIYAL